MPAKPTANMAGKTGKKPSKKTGKKTGKKASKKASKSSAEREREEEDAKHSRQLAAALESPSATMQIGPRVFRLNMSTGIAYVIDGPKLPGASGPGLKERSGIMRALPSRPAGTVEGILGWRLTDEPWAEGKPRRDPLERRDHRCLDDKNPEIVFTMGLPGSGKSTILRRMGIYETHNVIDPDAIKQELPGYDPKNPGLVHEESSRRAEALFVAALRSGTGRHAVDGTGTSVETMVRRIRQAQLAGFYTRVIYVRTTLATALARNAARERVVPEWIVRDKARDIETSVSLLQEEADCFVQVNND